MKLSQKQKRQTGFTLIEVMVSVAIFVVISGAIFGLLGSSQKQFRTESQLLGSFQEARLGLDQIVRDANDAGYPPQNHFSTLPTADKYTKSPVAWSFDVIFEGDVDGSGVKWIRYQLQRTTLYRGVTPKVAGADPVTATNAAGVMLPYVTNVMNNASATQIAQFQAAYPGMFPGGIAQPIFQFSCGDSGPVLCQNAGASNSPLNVRDIEITLIVMTTQPDAQTGKVRLVELNGRGRRFNPNQ